MTIPIPPTTIDFQQRSPQSKSQILNHVGYVAIKRVENRVNIQALANLPIPTGTQIIVIYI